MILSIITPHYNDFEGLEGIYSCLKKQTIGDWEWIIVDDFSDSTVLLNIKEWKNITNDSRITFMENSNKTNASVCRNRGLEVAVSNHLVFLDSDDFIAEDFVANRDISFEEFAVFPNFNVVDGHGLNIKRKLTSHEGLLNKFLSAKFLWQTSCVLWNKEFLRQIGSFDPNLERLQDVELCIRALFASKNYLITDNKVDFFYHSKPISSRDDIVRKSCGSVNYLILNLHNNYNLDAHKNSLIKSYYFACVKGLHRCKDRKNVDYVKGSLKQFFKLRYINLFEYYLGYKLLFLYQNHMMSDSLFLRVNRYFFK